MQEINKTSWNQIIPTADLSRLFRDQIRLRIKHFGMQLGSRALATMMGSSLSVDLKDRKKSKK